MSSLTGLSESVEKVSRIFDNERVGAAARQTGFVRRESVLTGHLFLTVFVFSMSICGTPTPEQMIGLLHMALPVISISRPGLHQRINEKAVAFFEFMLSEAVRINVPRDYDPNVLDNFDGIIITESDGRSKLSPKAGKQISIWTKSRVSGKNV